MIDFLSKVPLFINLNSSQLTSISNICSKKSFRSGTILFNEKELGSVFYIVFNGSVKIYNTSTTGEEKILSLFKSGDSFGELSLIDGKPRSASAQTLEDSVLIALDAKHFLELLKNNFDISLCIMRELCNRLRDTNQHVYDLTFLDARTRVIKSLIKLANKNGTRNGNVITIKMMLNYDEVSQMAGVQKPILMQVMRDFQEREILVFDGPIMKLDLAKLRG
ncbi:Crp/Fnr family transcriptional regulator [Paenibacillus radicis (ex Xue et al. 2023)]|uniref:Crp/Fnr family transcriptional regulator n=1 Tax=Paenibacillus radicis (ex Xue et al. 2023) TaxID=2972489 RepID=A0ABT1YCB3_9BACL|nr:Crp/Fnr family transcriptional regulator [Paenibacillus radicis (ex Xue et al. 2023)]MCR8629610.1 Crp/Fnr family transcriptional regulator [Paenibacillus radicis (ex Xue et al. 2023)]